MEKAQLFAAPHDGQLSSRGDNFEVGARRDAGKLASHVQSIGCTFSTFGWVDTRIKGCAPEHILLPEVTESTVWCMRNCGVYAYKEPGEK